MVVICSCTFGVPIVAALLTSGQQQQQQEAAWFVVCLFRPLQPLFIIGRVDDDDHNKKEIDGPFPIEQAAWWWSRYARPAG